MLKSNESKIWFVTIVAVVGCFVIGDAALAQEKADLSIPAAVGQGKSAVAQQASKRLMKALVPKATGGADKDGTGDVVTLSWQTIFTDGFEGAWYWTTYGYPTWGDTSYRSHTGLWSAWCADDGLSPPGPYASNMDAYMVYGPFDLSDDADDARVTFSYWLDSESGYDYFWWLSSGNGTNFSGYRISGYFPYWQSQTFSLSNHLGDSSVWFAFNFDSDSSFQYEGAYVDDVVIEKRVLGSPPLNDECVDAIPVYEGVPYDGSTVSATGVDESSCGYNDTADVWHSYTPASTGLVTISLAGSAFDTTLAVFDSCGGMELACNDDLCDNLYSQIKMNMTEGNTYLIRIAGYNGAAGNYTLTVTNVPCVLPPEPNSPSPANDANYVPIDTVLSWNGSEASGVKSNKAAVSTSKDKDIVMPKVIYGPDDRRDECEVNDPNILAAGDSTVVMLPRSDLTDNGNGTFSLPPETFAWWYEQLDPIGTGNPLCPDEPFRNQPAPGWCSGFLVAPDIIATAGHCECSINCSEMAFVFGFIVPDCNEPNIAVLTVAESEVYYCSEVIISETGHPDLALIRLDREVTGHSPLSIRREGKVSNDQELIVIGYPFGLPRKYDDGATVRDNTPWAYFLANLDTYVGSSGGPVLNADTLDVEGILWGGQQDFAAGVVCDRSNVCPDTGCPGWEYVTRAAVFAPLVPWQRYDVYFDVNCPPTQLICSDIDVPTCDPCDPCSPDGTLRPGTTYYWQVVAKNSCGETPGPNDPNDCWTFTTEYMDVNVTLNNDWMYQNLPGSSDSNLTACAEIIDDPMGNSSYTYEWEFILPSDVNIPPETVVGGEATDAFCTFAAPDCNEPNGISDSGQVFTVKVTVTGDDHGNTGTAQAEFGIALLGDVNNDCVVNVIDRAIITTFWRTGSAGDYCLRDCDLNCDGRVNVIDRSIVTAIWKGTLCQNDVNEPCPLRSPCP